VQRISRQPVQQRGEERPVGRREPDPLLVQLALKYCDLVAQRQEQTIRLRGSPPRLPATRGV